MNIWKRAFLTVSFGAATLGGLPERSFASVATIASVSDSPAKSGAREARRIRAFEEAVADPSKSIDEVKELLSKCSLASCSKSDLIYLETAREQAWNSRYPIGSQSRGQEIIRIMKQQGELQEYEFAKDLAERMIPLISDTTKTEKQIQTALNGNTMIITINDKDFYFRPSAVDFLVEIRKELFGGMKSARLTREETLQVIKQAAEKDDARSCRHNYYIIGGIVLGLIGGGIGLSWGGSRN